jgi:hypothetical protein
VLPATSLAQDADDPHKDLGEVGAKLSNPVSNVWALFTEIDLTFSDGNANKGDDRVGSENVIFQPIMPIPLYGEEWKLITRPTIPVVFSKPRPDGFDKFNHDSGIADSLLPLLLSPDLGQNWLMGIGPTITFPTSTNDSLGRQQWAMGPAGVFGYKTPEFIVGLFPQYFWKVASRGDKNNEVKDANYMNLLYFAFINLPKAWQVGFNPTITYDHQADSGNKWNVPIGVTVTKTTRVGRIPVKFQLGAEYSVVSQDDFGKRALLKLNIIPVVPSLISKPIFGGD